MLYKEVFPLDNRIRLDGNATHSEYISKGLRKNDLNIISVLSTEKKRRRIFAVKFQYVT